jgi:hypothetical protein
MEAREVTDAAHGPAALMTMSHGMLVVEEEMEEVEGLEGGLRETNTCSAQEELWGMPTTSPVTNFTPKCAALFLKAKSSCQGSNQPSFCTPRAPQLMSSTRSQGNLSRICEGDLCGANDV